MQRVLTISTLALAMTLPMLCADQKQPTPKSKGEVDALQAMFGTQDPDARIKAVDALLSKYADTEFKAALYLEASPINRMISRRYCLRSNPFLPTRNSTPRCLCWPRVSPKDSRVRFGPRRETDPC